MSSWADVVDEEEVHVDDHEGINSEREEQRKESISAFKDIQDVRIMQRPSMDSNSERNAEFSRRQRREDFEPRRDSRNRRDEHDNRREEVSHEEPRGNRYSSEEEVWKHDRYSSRSPPRQGRNRDSRRSSNYDDRRNRPQMSRHYSPPRRSRSPPRRSRSPPRRSRSPPRRSRSPPRRSRSPPRRSRSPPRHQPPKDAPIISNHPEEGIICSLKDGYGFIDCVNLDENLFFHFSELPRDPIHIGTEVEVYVMEDPRKNKRFAIDMVVLPPGSVKIYDEPDEIYTGTIERELVNYAGRVPTTGHSNEKGLIRLKKDISGESDKEESTEKDFIPFTLDNTSKPELPLWKGDLVQFKISTHKKTKARHATNISIIEFAGQREKGMIDTLKDGYGYIICSDRNVDMFFHFNDVFFMEPHKIRRGLEVEYNVVLDTKNRERASRIICLPPGTISFKDILPERYTGIVKKVPGGAFSKHDFGIITVNIPGEKEIDLSFLVSDIKDLRTKLKIGDQVECSLAVFKRTKKKSATDIVLIESKPEERERGIVVALKHTFGYIAPIESKKQGNIFFHISEVQSDQTIHEKSEVEFSVETDFATGKKKATKVEILPKGTIQVEEEKEEVHYGTIVKECGHEGNSGIIKFGEQTIHFNQNDIEERISLWPEDEVEFKVVSNKQTKERLAKHIRLKTQKERKREVGTITSIKSNKKSPFGFIHREGRQNEVFFLLKELPHKGGTHLEGKKVEFSVVMDSWTNKEIAIHLKEVPKFTKRYHEKPLEGVVEKELRGRGHHSQAFQGKVSYLNKDNQRMMLDYSNNDVSERTSLRKGNKVLFHLEVDSQTNAKKATNIRLMREKGKIISIKSPSGIVKPDERDEQITFHTSEVEQNTALKIGDIVEFIVSYNTRKNELTAQNITKIEEKTTDPTQQYFSLKVE